MEKKKKISFKVTQLPQFSDTIKTNIVALSPQAAVCLLFYLFFERFVLGVGRTLTWQVDRNRSGRLVPHLPPCAPPVSASRGAVPTPQVWHGAQREHGEEHPLQLPGHAPVHGQIQPEGGGGRHHEPEDRVSRSFTSFAFCLFDPLVASSLIFRSARFHSATFFRRRNSCNSFKKISRKNMSESAAQTKTDSQDACSIRNKVTRENNSTGKCNKTYIYTDVESEQA